jgi:precorrin-6A synthase
VGVGPGDPELLTLKAARVLDECAVVTYFCAAGRTSNARRVVAERLRSDHTELALVYPVTTEPVRRDTYETLIAEELDEQGCGGILVWGDPSLYDSTLAIVDEILARGRVAFEIEVVPGISSIQALAAKHRISLTRVGRPVQITTGRRLALGFPADADDVVVMLDRGCSFKELDGESEIDIYWGAYVGSEDELLVAGELSSVADEIERLRGEARARKGWIMDSYLLRRRG